MQKIADFFKKWCIFLPAVIFLALAERWLAVAVGAINPVGALKFMKNSSFIHAEAVQIPNPFDDFVLPRQSDSQPQNSVSTAYHPQYNVIEEYFPSSESDIVLKKDVCYVKNLTHHSTEEVKNLMLSPVSFSVQKNSAQPQVLIYHTHATESYTPTANMDYTASYSWRNTDTNQNMVAVGKVMADKLNSLGYNTIQDTTLHDYPSYNGSYDLSKETVEKYLEKYPSIKIVLDVHRDAVERNGSLINPVITSQGTKYAQIMIISGCDNGYMNMPNYCENLKFATNLQNQLAKDTPGLVRPILFDYRNYNQQLSTGSILVEIGTHGSTLQQAKNSAEAFAISLAKMLDNI